MCFPCSNGNHLGTEGCMDKHILYFLPTVLCMCNAPIINNLNIDIAQSELFA